MENLTVDIFMGGTKALLWRAIGTDDKKLDETVNKMFKSFPPHEKG
jgi:hypothetical protein